MTGGALCGYLNRGLSTGLVPDQELWSVPIPLRGARAPGRSQEPGSSLVWEYFFFPSFPPTSCSACARRAAHLLGKVREGEGGARGRQRLPETRVRTFWVWGEGLSPARCRRLPRGHWWSPKRDGRLTDGRIGSLAWGKPRKDTSLGAEDGMAGVDGPKCGNRMGKQGMAMPAEPSV
jgi:hypothetical protein